MVALINFTIFELHHVVGRYRGNSNSNSRLR